MEGSEIFFTITECPLTAVATALVLIWFSRNSFEIALETVPESTIIESTTMSEDSGSRPRCATSICPPFFLSSTALMLEEPTSRPTIDFDPIPNMCPPFCGAGALARVWFYLTLSGSFRCRLRFAFQLRFHLARLLFHPLVQARFLEAPAIAQLKRGNLLLANVLVKRVWAHAQVLRRLANVHDFSRVSHSSSCLFTPVHFRHPVSLANCHIAARPQLPVRGLSVFRAYLNPEKPRLQANVRVLLGFPGVFWNWPPTGKSDNRTYCGPASEEHY